MQTNWFSDERKQFYTTPEPIPRESFPKGRGNGNIQFRVFDALLSRSFDFNTLFDYDYVPRIPMEFGFFVVPVHSQRSLMLWKKESALSALLSKEKAM